MADRRTSRCSWRRIHGNINSEFTHRALRHTSFLRYRAGIFNSEIEEQNQLHGRTLTSDEQQRRPKNSVYKGTVKGTRIPSRCSRQHRRAPSVHFHCNDARRNRHNNIPDAEHAERQHRARDQDSNLKVSAALQRIAGPPYIQELHMLSVLRHSSSSHPYSFHRRSSA